MEHKRIHRCHFETVGYGKNVALVSLTKYVSKRMFFQPFSIQRDTRFLNTRSWFPSDVTVIPIIKYCGRASLIITHTVQKRADIMLKLFTITRYIPTPPPPTAM